MAVCFGLMLQQQKVPHLAKVFRDVLEMDSRLSGKLFVFRSVLVAYKNNCMKEVTHIMLHDFPITCSV